MIHRLLNKPETAFGEHEHQKTSAQQVQSVHPDMDHSPMQTSRYTLPSDGTYAPLNSAYNQAATIPRLAFIGLGFLCLFVIVTVRLIGLTSSDNRVNESVDYQHWRAGLTLDTPIRAPIVDRNGELLAVSLPVMSVYVDPRDVLDSEKTIQGLSAVFPDMDQAFLRAQVNSENSHFRWVKRSISPREEKAIRQLGLPGVRFSEELRRFYPKGNLTSHVLGYTDIDGKGLAGIERWFDNLLTNTDDPVSLSLDIRAQHIIAEELQYTMDDFNAPEGAAVLLDTETSEVIALVSLPSFDPYNIGGASDEMLHNNASQGVFELGSIFKVFTIAMALDRNGVQLDDEYDIGSPLVIGRWPIEDFKDYGHYLSVRDIFAESSNKGTARLALDIGGATQQEFLRRLGLFSMPAVELNQAELGRPDVQSHWGQIQTATVSYGHGIAVSPLQVTNAFSAIVNDGTFRQPTLIKSESNYRPGDQVIRPETSEIMNELLRYVVTNGTGSKADAEGYEVGGKTGTADIASEGGYDDDRRNSSFIGAFPMNNPRYSLLVFVQDAVPNNSSHGFATGGWVAAPAFRKMVERLAPILDVAPTMPESGSGGSSNMVLD